MAAIHSVRMGLSHCICTISGSLLHFTRFQSSLHHYQVSYHCIQMHKLRDLPIWVSLRRMSLKRCAVHIRLLYHDLPQHAQHPCHSIYMLPLPVLVGGHCTSYKGLVACSGGLTLARLGALPPPPPHHRLRSSSNIAIGTVIVSYSVCRAYQP